jgi:hypothetical protein
MSKNLPVLYALASALEGGEQLANQIEHLSGRSQEVGSAAVD